MSGTIILQSPFQAQIGRLIKGGFKASFGNFLRGEKLGAKVKKAREQRGEA